MNPIKKIRFDHPGFRIAILVLWIGVISTELVAQSLNNDLKNKAIDGSIGLGSIIAVVASWSRNQSILFAILHGLMGWFYVIYFVITREESKEI